MSGIKYKVVIKGYGSDKGEYYIEEDFAKLFKISHNRAKELIRSAPAILKEGLSKEEAERYANAIRKTGVKCDIDDMRFDFSGLSIESD